MNAFNNAVNAWWSIVFYSANFAPWFTRGMCAMIATSIALVIWCGGLSYMIRRDHRRRTDELDDRQEGTTGLETTHQIKDKV